MRRLASPAAFGPTCFLAVAMTVGGTVAQVSDEEEKAVKAARADLLDLAKTLEAGKAGANQAAAINRKHQKVKTLMQAFKPTAENGIGFGKPGPRDSIELKVVNTSKRGVPADRLATERADLIKMGYVTAAVAEALPHYAPAGGRGGKGPNDWKRYAADLKQASRDLITAVRAGNPADVQPAARRINDACNSCHSAFR